MKKFQAALVLVSAFFALPAFAIDIDCFSYKLTATGGDYVCIESKGDVPLPSNVMNLFFADFANGQLVEGSAVEVKLKESEMQPKCMECAGYDVDMVEKPFRTKAGPMQVVDLEFRGGPTGTMEAYFGEDNNPKAKRVEFRLDAVTDESMKTKIMSNFAEG